MRSENQSRLADTDWRINCVVEKRYIVFHISGIVLHVYMREKYMVVCYCTSYK